MRRPSNLRHREAALRYLRFAVIQDQCGRHKSEATSCQLGLLPSAICSPGVVPAGPIVILKTHFTWRNWRILRDLDGDQNVEANSSGAPVEPGNTGAETHSLSQHGRA